MVSVEALALPWIGLEQVPSLGSAMGRLSNCSGSGAGTGASGCSAEQCAASKLRSSFLRDDNRLARSATTVLRGLLSLVRQTAERESRGQDRL